MNGGNRMSSNKITKLDFSKMSKSEKGARLESRNEEALNILINDEDGFIRGSVAMYGNDKHRDILVNDKEWHVRSKVAKYGNDKHRDILVNDIDWCVRAIVASLGNDKHRDILVNDKDSSVREKVAMYGNDFHQDILINDKDWHIRKVVAKFGNDEHRDILINDETEDVSKFAKKYMGSKVHILTKQFGTYNGANILQMFEDGYKIITGCYETSSLTEWIDRAKYQRLSEEVIEKEVEKIKEIIEKHNTLEEEK